MNSNYNNGAKYRQNFISDPEDMQVQWQFVNYLNKVIRGARADYSENKRIKEHNEQSLEQFFEYRDIPSSCDGLESVFETDSLNTAMNCLTNRERWILEQLFYQNRSATDLAEELNISRQRVNALKRRALQKLRTMMQEDM